MFDVHSQEKQIINKQSQKFEVPDVILFDFQSLQSSQFTFMNYQLLKQLLPKTPQKWNVDDVATWLEFIRLELLIPPFKEHSIDGSCIFSLQQKDLREQLKISSSIIVRKIMRCKIDNDLGIQIGLTEFQQYLNRNEEKQPTQCYSQRGVINSIQSQQHIGYNTEKRQNIDTQEDSYVNHSNIDLYLQQLNVGQTHSTLITKDGAKIGRGSANQISACECDVSRSHAQIYYENNKYYIRDRGSVTGTFIKINKPIQIKQGSILEIGSHELEVKYFAGNKIGLSIISQDGGAIHLQRVFDGPIGIGRNLTNKIVIENDSHISKNHGQIYQLHNRYFFKDLDTVNGWFRLSSQSSVSEPFQLTNQLIIKIGSNMTYSCQFVQRQQVQTPVTQNTCAICYVNVKDCVLIPCNHNSTCLKCCKSLKECPVCRFKIQSVMRIYHT